MNSRCYATCLAVVLGLVAGPSTAHAKDGDKEIAAIDFLGTVDCYWYPEAQTVLIQSLKEDPRERVRYAAAKALRQQLQRGKRPLDPLNGWRDVPDPLILTQINRLARWQQPLTTEEMIERYSERKFEQEQKKGAGRGDTDRGCCNDKVIEALSRAAHGQDSDCCYFEPSERIRLHTERTLLLCVDQMVTMPPSYPAVSPELSPTDPTTSDPVVVPDPVTPTRTPPRFIGGSGYSSTIAGRADTTNRFNIFDSQGAIPHSRALLAYQFVKTQNNAILLGDQSARLFEPMRSAMPGTSAFDLAVLDFVTRTGFGTPGTGINPDTGEPASTKVIGPSTPDAVEMLIDEYERVNAGRTGIFLDQPNTNLYRFGFEYALTLDFSIAMVGQYVTPLGDVGQPDAFSNPLIQLKHVLYRGDDTVFSGILGVSPQIPRPKFSIGEKTTRINPGLLAYHELDDRWFLQAGTGFSLPTVQDNITTWDYVLGGGYWLYKHESMNRFYEGPKSSKLLLGVIPQVEVLGKHVVGDATVLGQFDVSDVSPRRNPGTFNTDGSTEIFLPDGTRVDEVVFFFEEPRHVVDMTFALTTLFRNNVQLTTGLSVPVTGGNSRVAEFIATLTYGF